MRRPRRVRFERDSIVRGKQQVRARVAKPGNSGGLKIRSRRGPCVQIASLALCGHHGPSQTVREDPRSDLPSQTFSRPDAGDTLFKESKQCPETAADSRFAPAGSSSVQRGEASRTNEGREVTVPEASTASPRRRLPEVHAFKSHPSHTDTAFDPLHNTAWPYPRDIFEPNPHSGGSTGIHRKRVLQELSPGDPQSNCGPLAHP